MCEVTIHMADGYARAIGAVGVCAATTVPGASDFVTGLYTAQMDSIPILAITGQNVTAQLGRGAFQVSVLYGRVVRCGHVQYSRRRSVMSDLKGKAPTILKEFIGIVHRGKIFCFFLRRLQFEVPSAGALACWLHMGAKEQQILQTLMPSHGPRATLIECLRR